MRSTLAAAIGAATLFLVSACSAPGGLFTREASPYDSYRSTIERSGLHQTALGRDWLRVGAEALQRSLPIATPFAESVYFAPDQPSAVAYRFELSRGRRLEFTLAHDTATAGQVFVDLFVTSSAGEPQVVTSLAAGASTFTYIVNRDGTYILRVQPELLRGGRVTVTQRTLAALDVFPVQGLTAQAVQSEFGAARDAGRRVHQGIDIFASRGTAVVSVADGFARADTNNLGGKVVWLRDLRRGVSYYYAHLDAWAINGMAPVAAGDVIGYVGNTGNARTTPPHLHFGIYAGGAIDPLPFVAAAEELPPPPNDRLGALGQLVRTAVRRTVLRESTHTRAREIRVLEDATVGRVVGVAGTWLRLRLPDGTEGYTPAQSLVLAAKPLRRVPLSAAAALHESPSASGPVIMPIAPDTAVGVLGRFGDFDYVETTDGQRGWVPRRPASMIKPVPSSRPVSSIRS